MNNASWPICPQVLAPKCYLSLYDESITEIAIIKTRSY